MKYRIYPSIGIARVGNSPTDFYIGSERLRHPGVEMDAAGEHDVLQYKDTGFRIKRQGARFHVFEDREDGTQMRPIALPPGASIEWTVHLVNKKSAIVRPDNPPAVPTRPTLAANAAQNTIDPGSRTVAGASSPRVLFDTGMYRGTPVPLGEVFTDSQQNLIVLGGHGSSSSSVNPPQIDSFYTNANWHDDTSDGPVSARIVIPGSPAVDAVPAWVVVATPDFAPGIGGIVTLYDVMLQVGVAQFGVQLPAKPSFTRDVFPMLERTRNLRWVNPKQNWLDMSDDWARLAEASAANRSFRNSNRGVVKSAENALSDYRLTASQKSILDAWVNGNFESDWQGMPAVEADISPDGLTRSNLQSAVGQGFFPGIEAGIIVTDPTLYAQPFDFRIDHASVAAGDLTALMAVPWQADFMDCAGRWWPSQRPDAVRRDADSPNTVQWARGVNGHLPMVKDFGRLGFVKPVADANGQIVFVEQERDPNF